MKQQIAFLMTLMLVLFFTCCSLTNCSSKDDDDDDVAQDDQSQDDDDTDENEGPPVAEDECEEYCDEAKATIAIQCDLVEADTVLTAIQECITRCKSGEFGEASKSCFDNFTDCETLISCLGGPSE